MIPFLQLETLPPDALLSIANYLRAEVATLEHNIQFMLGQYKLSYSKLEEANRVRLAKLGLENTPMAEDQPADTVAAAPVGGSPPSA
jgi:membrane-bound lytic murein transglycosylase B